MIGEVDLLATRTALLVGYPLDTPPPDREVNCAGRGPNLKRMMGGASVMFTTTCVRLEEHFASSMCRLPRNTTTPAGFAA